MVKRPALDPQTPLGSAQRPLRGPFIRWPRTADAVLAIAVFLWNVLTSFEGANEDFAIRALGDIPVAAYFVFAVASGALYWRRFHPLVVLGVNLAALAVLIGLGDPDLWALTFALYSVGRYATNDRWSYYGVGATLPLVAFNSFVDGEPAGSRNGPTNLDSAVSEIFLGFQAANSGAAWPKYTASGVRRSSALCRRLAL